MKRIVFSHGIAENGIFRCPHIAALQAIGQGEQLLEVAEGVRLEVGHPESAGLHLDVHP